MRIGIIKALFLSAMIGGCAPQLSPPRMIGDESSDLAVREFLLAGQALANDYGLTLAVEYAPQPRLPQDPFGISLIPAVPYSYKITDPGPGPDSRLYPLLPANRWERRAWFLKAGHHASQMVCRNYLSGLRDRNEYFEFLQKEFNTGASLVQVLMPLTSVPEKTKDIFTQVVTSANLGIDAYQTFKFMTPDIETILPLVEAAQVAMRDYYLSDAGAPATFAGALNAVSKIEYQCSRSGIRAILNKTLVQAKPQYTVVNGTLYSMESKDPPQAGTGGKPAPAGTAQKAPSLPAQTPPAKQSEKIGK